MSQFKQHEVQAQPVYKNYNSKVDIITGEIMDTNSKNAGYERFTENAQNFKSSNQSQLPSDLTVQDPITGRDIIRRWDRDSWSFNYE